MIYDRQQQLVKKFQKGENSLMNDKPLPDSTLALRDAGYKDFLMKEIIKEKGGTPEQYNDLMDRVAFHESKYLKDKNYIYNDITAKQTGGGPGRGLYMFENSHWILNEDTNEMEWGGGALTAATRARNNFKRRGAQVPEWIEEAIIRKDLDASTLSKNQQDILFLANYRDHPYANFSKVWDGTESVVDFWGKYHQTKDDPNKKTNFLADMEEYNKLNK